MIIATWRDVLTASFQDLWVGVALFVPNLVVAVIIFILGWIVGTIVGRGIHQLFKSIKVDEALKKTGADEMMHRGGMNLDSGAFVGGLVKWFIIVVFLIASFDVLGLEQVNQFLREVVLGYLPRVIVAVLVLLVGGVLGDAMQRIVVTSARAAHVRSSAMLGAITRWSIWIFAFLAALYHLGIAAVFTQTLFTGFIVALALAIGLSFGLGGQDAAAHFISRMREEMKE